MKRKDKRSPELQSRIDATKASAHRAIVASGKIQFRLDAENMELLLRTADHRCTGAGVLARMWVIERLKSETDASDTIAISRKALADMERRLHRLEQLQLNRAKRKHA